MHSGKIIWVLLTNLWKTFHLFFQMFVCLRDYFNVKKQFGLFGNERSMLRTCQAKGNEIQTANLKLLDEGVAAREGEKLPLSVKDSSKPEAVEEYDT